MIRVLDASVVVKWFLPEDPASTGRAVDILNDLQDNPRPYAVPELLYSECLHVFAKHLRDPAKVEWAMGTLFRLGITPLRFDQRIAHCAAPALRAGMTGYDATYYAFAADLGAKWVTFDRQAAARAPDQRFVELL